MLKPRDIGIAFLYGCAIIVIGVVLLGCFYIAFAGLALEYQQELNRQKLYPFEYASPSAENASYATPLPDNHDHY